MSSASICEAVQVSLQVGNVSDPLQFLARVYLHIKREFVLGQFPRETGSEIGGLHGWMDRWMAMWMDR